VFGDQGDCGEGEDGRGEGGVGVGRLIDVELLCGKMVIHIIARYLLENRIMKADFVEDYHNCCGGRSYLQEREREMWRMYTIACVACTTRSAPCGGAKITCQDAMLIRSHRYTTTVVMMYSRDSSNPPT
jgi:hypothetical protein